MAALASVFALPKPSAKLCIERERLAVAGAPLNLSQRLLGERTEGMIFYSGAEGRNMFL